MRLSEIYRTTIILRIHNSNASVIIATFGEQYKKNISSSSSEQFPLAVIALNPR